MATPLRYRVQFVIKCLYSILLTRCCMTQPVLISIAWPYANAEIHVGNVTGSHLPGDIAARYHRMKGDKVLMVSGTDSHGTPVTLRADAEGVTVGLNCRLCTYSCSHLCAS